MHQSPTSSPNSTKKKSIHPPQAPTAETKLEKLGLLTIKDDEQETLVDGQAHIVVPQDLAELAEDARVIRERIEKRTVEMIYDVVSLGLLFLKAREAHERQSSTMFGAAPGSSGEGYRAWLSENVPGISHRTAQNYTNAALNAGLSAGSPATAVDALKKQKALHSAKPTQLYRSPQSQLPDGTPLPERPKPDLTRDVINDLITHCRHTRDLRDTMNDDQLALACRHLQHTLEYMVQAEYDITGVKTVSRDFQG